jgi:hypothetical protein
MLKAFGISVSTLLGQPSAEKLILRSTNAGDTMNFILAGNVSGTPTAETIALVGTKEVQSTNIFQTLVSARLASSAAGTVTVLEQGIAGQGSVILDSNPADGDTLSVGLSGYQTVYRFKNTLAAAYDIKIGAAAANTAASLDAAFNASGTPGTDYYAGTLANPLLVASALSSTAFVVTDALLCRRQLAWNFSQTGTSPFSLVTPIGGVDGNKLASLPTTVLSNMAAVTLDDDALTGGLMPPNASFVSDWISVSGKEPVFYIDAAAVSSGITASYQTALNTAFPRTGLTAISNLNNNSQVIHPSEKFTNYVRLLLTNPNATPASVNAKLVTS